MNPNIKAQWLDALRSDEFEQGTGTLTRVNDDGTKSHCCLGVLCELAADAGVVQRTVDETQVEQGIVGYTDGQNGAEVSILPHAVADWAGLDRWGNPDRYIDLNLPGLNDSGQSFDYIADVIENSL